MERCPVVMHIPRLVIPPVAYARSDAEENPQPLITAIQDMPCDAEDVMSCIWLHRIEGKAPKECLWQTYNGA